MDLDKLMTESAPIKLADVFPPFKSFEGEDVADEDRIWVTVRQVTQEDNMKRSSLLAKRETKYERGQDSNMSVSDVVEDNIPRRHMLETFWTLTSVTNLSKGGAPVFTMQPGKPMKQNDFERAWGSLPPLLAIAIHEAVLSVNPMWGGQAGEL